MRFEANNAGFPVVRQGGIASFPFSPVAQHATMFIDMNAFAGDSGGPVIAAPPDRSSATNGANADEPLVLGLITGQVRHDERSTGLMEERVTHYPLGVALMIQAQFIRETIVLLANPKP
jgi:hypothetical protein